MNPAEEDERLYCPTCDSMDIEYYNEECFCKYCERSGELREFRNNYTPEYKKGE